MADRCGFRWSAPYLNPDGGITSLVQVCCLAADHDGHHESSTKVIADNPFSPVSRHARDGETREQRGHRIDQRFISDVRRAYNLRGGETAAWVVQRIGNAIAELNAQRSTLGEPPGPHLIASAQPARDGETLSDERRIDELLREFQMACEDAAEFNADSIRASAKHRAILRNELRSELLAIAALRAELAALRAKCDAWEDLAEHEVWCRCCAEGGTENCDDGGPLIRKARELRAARAASGEDASR